MGYSPRTNTGTNHVYKTPDWLSGIGEFFSNLFTLQGGGYGGEVSSNSSASGSETYQIASTGATATDPLGFNAASAQQQLIDDNKLVRDNSTSELEKLAKDLGMKLTPETLDYLYEYMLNEKSAENAYNRSLQADSEKYQRAVQDLQKAGINPFLAIQGLSAGSVSSPVGSVSGGYATARKNAQLQANTQNSSKWLSVIAMIAMAVISTL